MFDILVADPHSVYPGMKNLFHKFSDHTSVNSYNLPLDGAPSKMSFFFPAKMPYNMSPSTTYKVVWDPV